MKNTISLICILLCLNDVLVAQEIHSWSLHDCVEYALEHNASLKQEQFVNDTKELGVKEKKWAFSPRVIANSSFSASSGRVLDQTTYEYIGNSRIGAGTYSIAGTVTLFNGFRSHYELEYSKLDAKASHYRMISKENELRQQVIEAYLLIKCNESALESAKQIRDIIGSQLRIIEQRVAFGRAVESDFLSAKAKYYEADSDVVTAEGNLEVSKNNLCYLLGIIPPIPFLIADEEADIPTITNLNVDLENLPEYNTAIISISMAEKERQVARSYYYPSLTLSFGYGSGFSTARQLAVETVSSDIKYVPYPFVNQLRDNASLYFTLNLSIPLFNQYSTIIQSRKASLALENARNSFLLVNQELHQKVKQIEIECRSLYKQHEMAIQEYRYAESTEIALREKYSQGIVDYNTWSISLVNLAKVKYSLIETRYSYLIKAKLAQLLLNHYND